MSLVFLNSNIVLIKKVYNTNKYQQHFNLNSRYNHLKNLLIFLSTILMLRIRKSKCLQTAAIP